MHPTLAKTWFANGDTFSDRKEMGTTVLPLPLYPSHGSLSSLSPSQHSSLTQQISNALQNTLALPPAKRDTPATRAFVDSYAREGAREALEATIWDGPNPKSRSKNKADAAIRNRVLLLAEKLASSQAGLEIETIIDLCVVYSTSHPNRLRAVLASAFKTSPALLSPSLPDAFTSLLQPSSPSLYALRKTSFCLLSLLRAGPNELSTLFARDKQFMLALGRGYDTVLTGIARSYGGLRSHEPTISGEGDDWEKVWIEAKVALMDSFHVLLSAMISGLVTHGAGAPGLGSAVEEVFDVVFALLDLPSSSSVSDDTATPFLNRSLLADYQHAYNMTHTLAQALSRQAEQDARIEVLEASLASASSPDGPGALKIILRSSGAPPGVDMRGPNRPSHKPVGKDKGKGKAPAVRQAEDPDQDTNIAQILSILPDTDPRTVRALLRRDGANVETVLGMLLEGAGMPDDLQLSDDGHAPIMGEDAGQVADDFVFTQERRNVFDDEVIDVSNARVGKKKQNEETVLRDRTFIEEMKADILRRAELISDSEDEEAEEGVNVVEKQKGRTAAYEDELEEAPGRVHGDGEDSAGDEDSGDDEEGGVQEENQSPETLLELAYIQDPSVFERDAATRRGKARQALCDATHMSNEQIEGWRIMLERDPKKDKRLQKHEFSGNHNQFPPASVPSSSAHGGSRGRGGGRGGGGGGGGARGSRGRGGAGGGSGGADGDSTRERAWKDKNKASRGNHNRKRGHDKKMARGGGGFPPV